MVRIGVTLDRLKAKTVKCLPPSVFGHEFFCHYCIIKQLYNRPADRGKER